MKELFEEACKLCKVENGICKTKEGVASNGKDGHMDPVKTEGMRS